MPLDLTKPIDWTDGADAEVQAMLSDLQGNILKGHGRHATRNLFLRFGQDDAKTRLMLRRLGALTISALDQLRAAETHKRARVARLPGGGTPTFFTVMLTHEGYAKLGLAAPDGGDAFRDGMLARAGFLNDSDGALDAPWKARPDALVLIGADPDDDGAWTSDALDDADTLIAGIITPLGGEVVIREDGRAIFRTQPGLDRNGEKIREGIEHFGYVDGRSQPLFLADSIADEPKDGPEHKWDPAFPAGQVLVPDPASAGSRGFGSFFVFRKLEQDVKGFKETEKELGKVEHQGLPMGEKLAGAMLVGRFEDGTPVTLEREPKGHAPVLNDFEYDADMEGLRCPFHGQIRKTNPRGDTQRLFGDDALKDERSRIMARRGITYGERDRTIDPQDKPTRDVGLLFMSYQRDLAHQFEFTQQKWANEPLFAPGFNDERRAPGRDPIIGQRGRNDPVKIKVRQAWDNVDATVSEREIPEHVTFKGGDYFFAPARSTLLSL